MTSANATYLLVSGALFCLSIVSGLVGIKAVKRGHLLLTSSVLLSIVVLDSIGLSLLPYVNWSLPYAEAHVVYEFGDPFLLVTYTWHVLAHLVVQIVLISQLLLSGVLSARSGVRRNADTRPVDPRLSLVALWGAPLSIAWVVYFYHRYFLQGPGMDLLYNSRFNFETPEEAIIARSIGADLVGIGQGAFGATIAAYVCLPYLAGLGAMRFKRWGSFLLLWVTAAGLSLAFAVQTYQKAPIGMVVLVYLGIALLYAVTKNKLSPQVFRTLRWIALVGTALGVGLYVVNFGLSPAEALYSFIARIFLVPANTEGYWFVVYPTILPFRGVAESLWTNMKVIRETAYAATGDIFSSNASFIAVGWAGAGLAGVVIGVLTLLAYTMLYDYLARDRIIALRVLLMLIGGPSLFMLLSGSLGDFIFKGGVTPLLLLVSTRPGKALSSALNSRVTRGDS